LWRAGAEDAAPREDAPSRAATRAAAHRVKRMRIRAAVLEDFGRPLNVTDLDLAEPKAGEALVRLVACGVCHTDLYTASGADPSGYAPTVLGHEGAGIVEAVGEGVTSVAPGDHVITLFSPQCRECVHCRSPKTNICLAIREQQNAGYLPDGTTRLSRDGEPILASEIDVDPFLSHHIALDEINRGFELLEAQDGIHSVITFA
jgi:Zn-dependent alcohol dehydrogenase